MSQPPFSEALAKAMADTLNELRWPYDFDPQGSLASFRFGLNLDREIEVIRYGVDIYEDMLVVNAVLPLQVDPADSETVACVADYVCRVNGRLANGNFEFYPADGQISYKTFVNGKGGVPPRVVLWDSLHIPVYMVERYARGLLAVISGAKTPRQAYAEAIAQNPS